MYLKSRNQSYQIIHKAVGKTELHSTSLIVHGSTMSCNTNLHCTRCSTRILATLSTPSPRLVLATLKPLPCFNRRYKRVNRRQSGAVEPAHWWTNVMGHGGIAFFIEEGFLQSGSEDVGCKLARGRRRRPNFQLTSALRVVTGSFKQYIDLAVWTGRDGWFSEIPRLSRAQSFPLLG